jgi:hypothetical protein
MKIKSFQPTLSLRPTQFAIGLLEAEYKVLDLRKSEPEKLERLLANTRIPVVITPWRQLCLVDHHHFLFACWHADIPQVRVEVMEDLSKSKLSYNAFWRMMAKNKWAYLYDQFGEGPRSPLYLPLDIRGMADDPYRSLAWMVRKEGGFNNSTESFAEFQWANFFRAKGLLNRHGREGFHEAVRKGLKLARTQAAADLPGYCPRANQVPMAEQTLLVKSKYVPKARAKGEMATEPLLK